MITPRQFAGLHDVAYTTVVGWLRLEMVEGAKKVELPHMNSHVYMIPEDAKPPELKPGPKKGSKRGSSGEALAENTTKTVRQKKAKTGQKAG